MNRIVLVVITLVILIILLVATIVVYSYTQISVSLDAITVNSVDWAALSWSTLVKLGLDTLAGNWLDAAFVLIESLNLNLVFTLTNNGLMQVYIPELSYDLFINETYVGTGNSRTNLTINPGQTKVFVALQNFQKSGLVPAIKHIVDSGGITTITVKGTAYFGFLGVGIPIPFESTQTVSLTDAIKYRLESEIERNKNLNSISSSFNESIDSFLDSVMDNVFGTTTDSLNLDLSGVIIVDSMFKVKPGSYSDVYFTLSCTAIVQGGLLQMQH